MRDHIILACVVVVATGSIVTALGVVWLCAHATNVASVLRQAALDAVELQDAMHTAVVDALLRIEEAAADAKEAALEAKMAAERTAESVYVGTELGHQNAESNRRLEGTAKGIADDLAEEHVRVEAARSRADAADAVAVQTTKDVAHDLAKATERANVAEGSDGAAADAASRAKP
ncbi:hypothetical protein [Iamia sp.]|uniref:hypothetical protein n=1 Tax=Iamia sp. TaxID=2722710 RepID=UPI002CBEFC85|nr:hypothetical protein [Iamia sp.]HXH59091.1 hypothetical protein [Iamia sp.]